MAIVLQETLRAVFYAPFYAALALGAYAREGVDARLVTAPKPLNLRVDLSTARSTLPGAGQCA